MAPSRNLVGANRFLESQKKNSFVFKQAKWVLGMNKDGFRCRHRRKLYKVIFLNIDYFGRYSVLKKKFLENFNTF